MKNSKRISAILFCTILLGLASCKKATSWDTPDPDAKQHNEDANNMKTESDNLNSEVNQLLNTVSGFGKNQQTYSYSICGATIDSSQVHNSTPTIIINFDGTTTCNSPSRIRSGSIKVELINGTRWIDAGAKLRITHINYKVKFPSFNNHSLTFNGVKYLTNVDGINWLNYFLQGQVTAKLRERVYAMQVTFDNGTTASWSHARVTDWLLKAATNELSATVNADTTINGKNLDSWGTNRFGNDFTTEMVQSWHANSICGWWKPTAGIYKHTTQNFTVTGTFWVNSSGNQTSSGCAYGFKLEWNLTATNRSGTAVISYWW